MPGLPDRVDKSKIWGIALSGAYSWLCLCFHQVDCEVLLLKAPGCSGHNVDGQANREKREDVANDGRPHEEMMLDHDLLRFLAVFREHRVMI